MKNFLVIGNPIEHSISPKFTITGLKKQKSMPFIKNKNLMKTN